MLASGMQDQPADILFVHAGEQARTNKTLPVFSAGRKKKERSKGERAFSFSALTFPFPPSFPLSLSLSLSLSIVHSLPRVYF